MTHKVNKLQVRFCSRISTVLFEIVSIGYKKVPCLYFWDGRISFVSVSF